MSDPIERSKFLGKIGVQFNKVGWASMITLIFTGLYNLVKVSGGASNVGVLLLRTNYGMILNAKLVLVLGMILITAHHTFISGPKVRKLILQLEGTPKESETVAKLQAKIRSLQRQNGLLMVILGLLALATLFFATLLVNPL